jgi:hypothetical protein
LPLNQPTIIQQGAPEQEETIDSDRSEPRRTHTNIPSSRDPSGNGIKYHLRRNVGMCPSWLWSVWVYGFLLFWSPLLYNSWLVQWQSADGGSCSTLQGEQVQRRAARFAYNCYQDNSTGCVTNLLNSLQWESLQQRRWKQTLVMCYKIVKASCPPLYLLYVSCDGNLLWVPYCGSILQNRSH